MERIVVNFENENGKMKPMHAVNNGPLKPAKEQTKSNFDAWVEAEIPMARNHDASFCASYGGEHTVDIQAVFPDFNADVNDPASYDFVLTDEYTKTILDAGTKVFYRFGSKIEWAKKKYGTWPPKDFEKWAQICEHIIMHYNEGWADGFYWDIEYWEIWNEPDLHEHEEAPGERPTWNGTREQFFDLYEITAKRLKGRFPNLKIGGPSLATSLEFAEAFLREMHRREVPIDFFSWHCYRAVPSKFIEKAEKVRKLLDDNGYKNTESILTEWNYVRGWTSDWVYTLEQITGIKGAVYTAASMCASQQSSVDMLMYYDARANCTMNGLFNLYTLRPLKGYYPFKMFSTLYKMGISVDCAIDGEDMYAVAAKDGEGNSSAMICYYMEDDTAGEKTVHVELENASDKYELYLLDEDHDAELLKTVESSFDITLKRNSVVLLRNA